ncbi:MAG: hypothetical protein NT067_06695 [Candidatus Diapherotrites archaeon]|nr:hypothetical protein [Candidatus Diapherotrites archaeon]
MDKKAIGSIALVALILGSTIGWGILELQSNQTQDNGGDTAVEPTPEEKPTIYFVAENLDANIFELSSVYPMKGYTDETNLARVLQALNALDSVDRLVTAEFQNPEPAKERFMPLYAEVVPAKDYNIEAVVEEIESKGVLSDLAVSRKAVVKIPVLVSMKSAQADLNLSKDVNFEEPFAGAIVSVDSAAGDELAVTLSLAMKGDEILKETVIAYMSENFSASPVNRLSETSAKIARLDGFLGFEKTIKYNGFDETAFKASLDGLQGVQKTEVLLGGISNSFALEINAEGTDLNALEQDINSAFSGIGGITKVAFTESGGALNARITYNAESGYPVIRPLAVSGAEKILAGKDYNFVDPTADLNCVLFLSDGSPSETALAARAAAALYGIDANFWQQAFFDANSLTDFQTGEEFVFPAGISQLPVRVAPGSELGQDLNLQILFQTTRKTIDVAYAAEVGQ